MYEWWVEAVDGAVEGGCEMGGEEMLLREGETELYWPNVAAAAVLAPTTGPTEVALG